MTALCTLQLQSSLPPSWAPWPEQKSLQHIRTNVAAPGLASSTSSDFVRNRVSTAVSYRHNRFAAVSQVTKWKTGACGMTTFAAAKADVEPVLVVGSTGGVGQLIVSKLLERGISVRAMSRNAEKAKALFSGSTTGTLEAVSGDARYPDSLKGKMDGIRSVIICTGTTAFPSSRWSDNNGPEQTDLIGTRNILAALPSSVKRIIYVSSIGVERSNKLPFNILNLFGVLKYKKMAEDLVAATGIPYTILRPARLTDGPYTSYDLNTLMKATSGVRKAVVIEQGDKFNGGEASRIVVAESACQALMNDNSIGKRYCLISVEGEGPGTDSAAWDTLFVTANAS